MERAEGKVNISDIKYNLKKEQRKTLISRFFSNKFMLIGSIITLFLVLTALVGPLLVSHDPLHVEISDKLQGLSSEYLLGTDNFGRDLLARIVYGSRVSMGVGLATAVVTSVLGVIIGLYSSYYRFLDHLLMRFCDGAMAIPAILLAIALMAVLGPATINVIIALCIVFTPYVARVVRSSALTVQEQTYIEAMKAQGASSTRIIWRHIAPNTISPLIVQATYIFAQSIITEAALSFLGAGVPPPNPSWGSILSEGKLYIVSSWWVILFPGAVLALAVLGLNLLGDGLRDLLDPNIDR